MAGVVAYTLPAMQLVCHLVASGNSINNVTNSATTQPPLQLKPMPLPDGYVAKPDLGFAYKYHSTKLVWIKAQNVCMQEGARLAVIDSPQKLEHLARQMETGVKWVLPGIIRTDNTWINVNTGELVAETVVWKPNQSIAAGNCVVLELAEPRGLIHYSCFNPFVFFCEIPILQNSTITGN